MPSALWRHPRISPRGRRLKPDWAILKPCLKVALPAALQRFGTSFGYVAFASLINSLGTISTAAHAIANTAESAFYIPAYGIQTAAATLSGNASGMKDREYMKALLRRNYLLGRKMTLTRAFNAFRERFEPVKKQMNDGVADEMNKKAAITAGELEKAQAVLRSLSEKLRQMG